jgi:hypothetical protein
MPTVSAKASPAVPMVNKTISVFRESGNRERASKSKSPPLRESLKLCAAAIRTFFPVGILRRERL